MNKSSGWKKITPDTIALIERIDKRMNATNSSLTAINKAIMAVTGIKTNTTIKLIRDSNYDSVKYKELSRLKYPHAYAPRRRKKIEVKLEDIRNSWSDIIINLEKRNSKIAHLLDEVIFSFYNGTYLTIKLVNSHEFQLRILEKDMHIIEAAIKDVLKKNIKVKLKPAEVDNNDNGTIPLVLGSVEVVGDIETSVFHHLNLNTKNIIDRIIILNSLINTYLNEYAKENRYSEHY